MPGREIGVQYPPAFTNDLESAGLIYYLAAAIIQLSIGEVALRGLYSKLRVV